MVEMPEELNGHVLTNALGRVGTIVPGIGIVVGMGASVGPNLYTHLSQGDPARETVTDVVVDLGGWGVSTLAGIVVAGGSGAFATGVTGNPLVVIPSAAIGDMIGSAGASVS